MVVQYNGQDFYVVESDFSAEGARSVIEQLKYRYKCYLQRNANAFDGLFSVRRISRTYTFLPADMSPDLQQVVLDHEHCTWGAQYFSETPAFQRPNTTYVPMTWRYVSQHCLKSKIFHFLDRDSHNLCALGAYDPIMIEKFCPEKNDRMRIGDLLCVGRSLLDEPMPVVLDSQVLDMFGFLSRLPGILPEENSLNASRVRYQYADEVIFASSHIFMEVHEGEAICILDLE